MKKKTPCPTCDGCGESLVYRRLEDQTIPCMIKCDACGGTGEARKRYKIGTLSDAQAELIGAVALIAHIRSAAGDPEGKLMQDELVEKIRMMREAWDSRSKGGRKRWRGTKKKDRSEAARKAAKARWADSQNERTEP